MPRSTRSLAAFLVLVGVLGGQEVVAAWQPNGVAVCTTADDQNGARAATDGSDGAIIAWKDSRDGGASADVYAQRLDESGNALWTLDGVVVCALDSAESGLQIVSDGSGGAIIAWEQSAQDGSQTNVREYPVWLNASSSPQVCSGALAGSLLEVGRRRWSPAHIRECLLSGERRLAGPTLPAVGLCLETVYYERELLAEEMPGSQGDPAR